MPTPLSDSSLDLALTLNGDLALGPDGDIAVISGVQVLQQEIVFRLKTKLGDYAYQPQCGSLLETLIGRPNSPETAALGEQYIRDALTHDGLVPDGALEIFSWPDGDAIVYTLLVDASYFGFSHQEALSLTLTLDLLEGLLL